MEYSDGPVIIRREADVKGLKLSVNLPVGQINAALQTKENPTLRFRMWSPGSSAAQEMAFRIDLDVPSKKSLKNVTLTPQQKKPIENFIAGVRDGRRIKWADVLATGLRVFLGGV